MLLILHDRLRSVRPDQVRTAYVPDLRHRGAERAREFLARFEPGEVWWRSALVEEIAACYPAAISGLSDNELIDAAAQGIASDTIRVALPVPARWRSSFDRYRPRAARLGAVCFPEHAAASGAVSMLLSDRHSAAALEQALHSSAAERGLLTVAPRVARALLGRPAPDPPTWPPEFGLSSVELTRLLAGHWLLLLPRGMDERSFRLAWAIHGGGASDDIDDGSEESAAPRTRVGPETQEGPRSTLPTPPKTLSTQAEALMAAAAGGYPFCEECAAGANAV